MKINLVQLAALFSIFGKEQLKIAANTMAWIFKKLRTLRGFGFESMLFVNYSEMWICTKRLTMFRIIQKVLWLIGIMRAI